MKILLLCNKSPWPPAEGGPIAMYAMITGLIRAGHTVKVIAANTNKYHVDPESVPEDFQKQTDIEFVDIDLTIKLKDALFNFLSGQSYHVSRFRTPAFEKKLIEILSNNEFDIVQAEMLYMTVYHDIIRKYSKARFVLRSHNIEHLIWHRIAINERNPLKRYYLRHLFLTLKNYELEMLRKTDGIVAITPTDAAFFEKHSGKTPVISIPFGIELGKYKVPVGQPATTDLFHIGSMNWYPNEEGIIWFLSKVWPLLTQELPSLKFYLAGREMPDWLKNLNSTNVEVVGEVPDALEFMHNHAVMVVPLFSGSGIRIKIIEAMAAGRAVISTEIGAEGIPITHGENILIANTVDEFIEMIKKVQDTGLRQKIGNNARKLVLSQHDNSLLMKQLTEFYQKLTSPDHNDTD
jgi:glycosyltransferase involved in cell wall biosynthesis